MTRIAYLGMYGFPATETALAALWDVIAADLRQAGLPAVPDRLRRDLEPAAVWRHPDLLLAQTCGYPLRTFLAGTVRLVATPLYAWPGVDGAWHRSFVIVAAGSPAQELADLRGTRVAINGEDSNSGMNLLRAVIAPIAGGRPFFSGRRLTGSHAASLEAVAGGEADIAAIDCVSYALITRQQPDLAGRVRVLATTPPSPSLPLVTAATTSDEEVGHIRRALARAAREPDLADARRALGLTGFAFLREEVYGIVNEYEARAAALGYPVLE